MKLFIEIIISIPFSLIVMNALSKNIGINPQYEEWLSEQKKV
mgnify:CR=1 FL=1